MPKEPTGRMYRLIWRMSTGSFWGSLFSAPTEAAARIEHVSVQDVERRVASAGRPVANRDLFS